MRLPNSYTANFHLKFLSMSAWMHLVYGCIYEPNKRGGKKKFRLSDQHMIIIIWNLQVNFCLPAPYFCQLRHNIIVSGILRNPYFLDEFLQNRKFVLLLVHVSCEMLQCNVWSITPKVWLKTSFFNWQMFIHQTLKMQKGAFFYQIISWCKCSEYITIKTLFHSEIIWFISQSLPISALFRIESIALYIFSSNFCKKICTYKSITLVVRSTLAT